MIEKYIIKEETVKRIEKIYADRRNFISSNCAIDSLLLVDGNTFDSSITIPTNTCKGCSNFTQIQDTLCVCVKLDLQELR